MCFALEIDNYCRFGKSEMGSERNCHVRSVIGGLKIDFYALGKIKRDYNCRVPAERNNRVHARVPPRGGREDAV